jgi:hypothetical protein
MTYQVRKLVWLLKTLIVPELRRSNKGIAPQAIVYKQSYFYGNEFFVSFTWP